jgi:hypothetical protein
MGGLKNIFFGRRNFSVEMKINVSRETLHCLPKPQN